ncbi:MAG: cytochrome c [Acidobacteriota bacterium]|nr:cytochrome c [Acidobacteriota bacterium]
MRLLIAVPVLALATACGSSDESKPSGEADGAPAAFDSRKASHEVIERGEEIYEANCIACHGEGGKGDGPAAGVLKPPPRDHTDKAYMSTLTDEDLKKVIVMGGAIKGRPLMPSHPQLRGQDLDALVAYVRSLSEGGGH